MFHQMFLPCTSNISHFLDKWITGSMQGLLVCFCDCDWIYTLRHFLIPGLGHVGKKKSVVRERVDCLQHHRQ